MHPHRTATLALALLALAPAAAPAQEACDDCGQPHAQPAAPSANNLTPEAQHLLLEGPTGSLAVRAVQGTDGGPPVADVDVEVVLYHNDHPIRTLNPHLDENGVVVLDDLPVVLGVRPVVRIQHAGVSYLEVGPMMDADHREAVVTVTVYETTDHAPQWRVAMRHIMAEPTPQGTHVSETVVVSHPGDRTWLGAGTAEKRNTVAFGLPRGATDIELLGGFHGWCCTELTGGDLVVQMPLMPGRSSFQFAYVIPPNRKLTELRVSAPAPTDQAVFFLPDTGARIEPLGLERMDDQHMGEIRVAMFQARQLEPGAEMGLRLTGIKAASLAPGGTAAMARTSAIVGVAALVAAAAIALGLRQLRRRRAART